MYHDIQFKERIRCLNTNCPFSRKKGFCYRCKHRLAKYQLTPENRLEPFNDDQINEFIWDLEKQIKAATPESETNAVSKKCDEIAPESELDDQSCRIITNESIFDEDCSLEEMSVSSPLEHEHAKCRLVKSHEVQNQNLMLGTDLNSSGEYLHFDPMQQVWIEKLLDLITIKNDQI